MAPGARPEIVAFRDVASGGLVRQLDEPAFHFPLSPLDEIGADPVSYAPRARVQHGPHAIRLIQADLDEVISGAERSKVARIVGREGFGSLAA